MPVSLLPLAVSSADLLRAVDAGGWATRSELAQGVGKAPNNISRDLAGLERAGLIEQDRTSGAPRPLRLTALGHEQLAAIGRAEHGGDKRKPRGRWPLDRIVRNPANRVPLAENVAARADTIEAAGDVLQEVLLTPPDANGVRMLLAGEHRWLGALKLQAEGRLPPALEPGLPFREREATDAERILIAIVENTQVALTPLQDARQLKALQDATGWSAREIAKKTGRSPEGSETGVRDVQSKIKVAREATPEALAEHEAGRLDWHQLRETVMRPKPKADAQAQAPKDAAVGKTEAADEQPRDWPDGLITETLETPFAAEQGWVEPLIRIQSVFGDGDAYAWRWRVLPTDGIARWGSVAIGAVDDRAAELRAAVRQIRTNCRGHLPVPALTWLDALLGPHVVDGVDCFNASNAGERRRSLGWEPRHANHGGAPRSEPPPPPPAALQTRADDEDLPWDAKTSEDVDEWDRDHNARVADQAVLRRAEDFVGGLTSGDAEQARRLLHQGIGVAGPFTAEDGVISADVAGKLQPQPIITIDVNAEWPPERAQALALVVAWALQQRFGPAEAA